MEQELNRRTFSEFVYDPSLINSDRSDMLAELVTRYPWSSLLKSFYTRTQQVGTPSFEKALLSAAISSPDRAVLKELIGHADRLRSERQAEEVKAEEPLAQTMIVPEAELEAKEIEAEAAEEQVDEIPVKEFKEEELVAQILVDTAEVETSSISEEKAVPEEDIPIQPEAEDESPELHSEVEDLSDIRFSEESTADVALETAEIAENESEVETAADELDSLIRGQVAPADYFSADEQQNIPAEETASTEETISRYDDDTMPYSFLWWLNKTRKEHTENYQPYVSFRLDTSQNIKRANVDPLSSQIIENIFHLQSPVDDLENAPRTVPFQIKRKEDDILDKFIREEPQIRAVASDKLDTENKARRSSEDSNDLVSETLAQIYTDQMLYHKAIDTYKKLSLKYPEKRTYFADQIRELEKKTT